MKTMATKFKITDHAYERFYERFGDIDISIESLLENSFNFGGQFGSQYFLLNKDHDVVFPIVREYKDHVVKTVLTLQQAKANLSLFRKISFEAEKPKVIEKPKVEPQSNKEREENSKKLKAMAQEYYEKHRCCPDVKERKKLFKEIKSILPISIKQFDTFFFLEITRIIRESNHHKLPKEVYYDGYLLDKC